MGVKNILWNFGLGIIKVKKKGGDYLEFHNQRESLLVKINDHPVIALQVHIIKLFLNFFNFFNFFFLKIKHYYLIIDILKYVHFISVPHSAKYAPKKFLEFWLRLIKLIVSFWPFLVSLSVIVLVWNSVYQIR